MRCVIMYMIYNSLSDNHVSICEEVMWVSGDVNCYNSVFYDEDIGHLRELYETMFLSSVKIDCDDKYITVCMSMMPYIESIWVVPVIEHEDNYTYVDFSKAYKFNDA